MTRLQLLQKVKARRESVGITIDNLSKISNLGYKTLSRFFAGHDVKLSTVEKVTETLGLDFAGNEIINLDTLRENRAQKQALYIVSLVQDTASLEMQGLDTKDISDMIQDTKMQLLYGDYKNKLWVN